MTGWWRIVHKAFFAVWVLGLVASGSAPTQDDSSYTLYFTLSGNLYSYDGEDITRLPGTGYLDRLSISANGTWLVYRTAAPEVLAAGGPTPYQDLPRSIMLMDTTSGEVQRISSQPANASDSVGVVRDRPTFSPDGQQVAWWEVDYSGEPYSGDYREHRLVVYDIRSGETTVRLSEPENPPIARGASLYELAYQPLWWGEGIAFHANGVTTVVDDDEPIRIPDTICGVEALWRLEGWAEGPTGVPYLAYTAQAEAAIYLIDPERQQCYRTESQPYYRAASASDDGLQLDIYPIDGEVALLNAAGEPVLKLVDPYSHISRNKRFALRPGGGALAAYHRLGTDDENTLTIWGRDGAGTALAVEMLEPGHLFADLPELAWGPAVLVLPNDAELIAVVNAEE